jgi:arabinose-5-phosphate isomerase
MKSMIEDLFSKQKQYINHFFDNVDLEKTKEIVNSFLNCKGSIIFTGVGKSGIIANKLAMTFLSTGTKALYLPTMDALHGDIAVVTKEDIVVLLSKSGETKELLSLLPYIRKKGAKIISIVSADKTPLSKEVDLSICLPLEKELCPFNLAPTTSTVLQLIFGDVLAVALMKEKNFSLEEYAMNHPAGAIGKRIALRVEDLLFEEEGLPLCYENDILIDILHVLSSKKCGSLIVVDKNEQLLGIFTDGDLRRSIQKHGKNFIYKKIKDLMTVSPKSISKDKLAIDAMKKMEEDKLITVLPVVDKEKVIGIIRMHDIIQAGLNY